MGWRRTRVLLAVLATGHLSAMAMPLGETSSSDGRLTPTAIASRSVAAQSQTLMPRIKPQQYPPEKYRFVINPRPEPPATHLLLGGLLVMAFMIRNRFRIA